MKKSQQWLYVLDTNVLMHDPAALFRFEEHDIYIPMVVLEELDHGKKGLTEVAQNVRQVSRFLDELMLDHANIEKGITLNKLSHAVYSNSSGKLFFQTSSVSTELPVTIPGATADNNILATTLNLQQHFPDKNVVLVSKDINLRIKAKIIGLNAEDYFNDKVLDDATLLYTGISYLNSDFWDKYSESIESWQKDGKTWYKIYGGQTSSWLPNECLSLENKNFDNKNNAFSAIVREIDSDSATIEVTTDYTNQGHMVWGIQARNVEQNLALNLLMDVNIDFVSLMGQAGTGKTILALAAALAMTLDDRIYREIIMTRVTVPVGEDIGFLPGTEEEKMTPWMGALIDNLEVLSGSESTGNWSQSVTNDFIQNKIKVRSLNYMRGRTFLNRFIILDEAQNLTAKQMKTLITRAGPGSKIVCLGNISQIDTPYLTETTSGLTYVVDRFKTWQHSGHVILKTGERSRLAAFASDNL